ncbi:MAG: 4Fe-4S dicluster domain-containing protein [Ignavibacteriaceae bacterium]|nr:4Fe-4S dicluster domain-containing protein [Ignavibacteriaceae bacterium]
MIDSNQKQVKELRVAHITDDCVSCGTCLEVCPGYAIFPGKMNDHPQVDHDLCLTDAACGDPAICMQVCPVSSFEWVPY